MNKEVTKLKRLEVFTLIYLTILSVLSSAFIYSVNYRRLDIVINIIIFLFGLYVINDFFRKDHLLSEVIFVLSLYNFMISGSMFFSNYMQSDILLENVAISIFGVSCVVMVTSKVFIDKNESHLTKQFNKWSIVGILSGILSVFFLAVSVKIENGLIKIPSIIFSSLAFVYLCFSFYKVNHYRNKM